MRKSIYVVFTEPIPGREDEFNDWYEREHIPDVLRVKGIVAETRRLSFRALSCDLRVRRRSGRDFGAVVSGWRGRPDANDFVYSLRTYDLIHLHPTVRTLRTKLVSPTHFIGVFGLQSTNR
jgi:hypothetical protein